jgi:hypothetical protein
MTTLFSLAFIFLQLSFLALGGGNAIIPELQRQVVDVHHWMTSREFSELFARPGRARPQYDDYLTGRLACCGYRRAAGINRLPVYPLVTDRGGMRDVME